MSSRARCATRDDREAVAIAGLLGRRARVGDGNLRCERDGSAFTMNALFMFVVLLGWRWWMQIEWRRWVCFCYW